MRQIDSSLARSLSRPKAIPAPKTPWRWLLAASALCAAMGAAAVGAFLWLLTVPTAPNCQRLSSLSPDIDRLYCAQAAAASGNSQDLLDGLNLMANWQESHPLHGEAQNWMAEWSDDILTIARNAVREGDLERGRELSQRIPPSSPSYEAAVTAIAEWEDTWRWGDGLIAEAEAALQTSNWSEVTYVMQQLRQSDYRYWRVDQPQALASQMTAEKAAQRHRAKAQRLAQAGTVEGLQQAIAAAQNIDPQTFVWEQMQADITQWGTRLLERGLQQWYAMDLGGAEVIGQLVADIPALSVEGYDLAILSRARGRANASVTNWEPTVTHLWELNRAIATAKAIEPDSRFYPQAAASIASWEQQLEDLGALYQARLAADGKQIPAFDAAIARANAVEGGRMRRLQAQTLAAHWQREVERIEDAPLLREARQIADSGQIDDLQSAIARASQIEPNRALYGEAQAAVGRWQSQVQTIQDRPILDRAKRYAAKGQLRQAIAEAGAIRRGRALTSEARALQRRWQSQIDAAARARASRANEASRVNEASRNRPAGSAETAGNQPPAQSTRIRQPQAGTARSTNEIVIPPLVDPAPQDANRELPFEPQSPESVPAEATPSTSAEIRFSPTPETEPLQPNEPAVTAPPPVNTTPPEAAPVEAVPVAPPAATPQPVEEVPAAAQPTPAGPRSSALPSDAAEPELQSQLQSQRSAPATPLAQAVEAALAAVQPSPEKLALRPETLPSREFLQDPEAFPLLYAGPLFAL